MNTVIHDFLAETDEDVLSTFVTGKKKNFSQINILIKTGKLLDEPFTEEELISAIEKELISRSSTDSQPTVKAMLKPIQDDPKALITVKAPEVVKTIIIASQPSETQKKASSCSMPASIEHLLAWSNRKLAIYKLEPFLPKTPVEPKLVEIKKSNIHSVLTSKLASMDDDTLLSAIRVFQVFPATIRDMHAPNIKMQDWEEACWDEAESRGLDLELEVVSKAAESDKDFLDNEFEEEVA